MLLWSLVTLAFGQATSPAAPRGSAGVGLAYVQDLGDRGDAPARLGPGLSLVVPLKFRVADAASLRVNPRIDGITGGGDGDLLCAELAQISWQVTPDLRSRDAATCGWMLAAGVTIGPEVRIPTKGAVKPYLQGGLGVIGTLIVDRIERGELVLNDPDRTRVDGWSVTASWLTDVNVGIAVGNGPEWFVEGGYALAWVPRARLRRTVDALDVRREPFGYNAVRLSTGIAWTW